MVVFFRELWYNSKRNPTFYLLGGYYGTKSTFRSALNGFNRADVVNYIEMLNNRHMTELEQLRNQLEDAQAKVRELEAAQESQEQPQEKVPTPLDELEAYRRAERTERQAQERAKLICTQANEVLGDVTARAEAVSSQIEELAEALAEQLEKYRQTVLSTKDTFRTSAEALAAMQPKD